MVRGDRERLQAIRLRESAGERIQKGVSVRVFRSMTSDEPQFRGAIVAQMRQIVNGGSPSRLPPWPESS